eukprot:TRINITY_DN10807_c0_g1_i1.p1 TRINITY_DN10807_c0_g1~~TRINITY_DN10807_c0_g1_i1.p1  ORF type:complete len:277 (-),score=56.18 TRINITY_DN10807_c0_g1_i1:135-965(-)
MSNRYIRIIYIVFFFFSMLREPPRSTLSSSSAASDVYKRQYQRRVRGTDGVSRAGGSTSYRSGMVRGPPAAAAEAAWEEEKLQELQQAEMAYRQACDVIGRFKVAERERLQRQIRVEEHLPRLQRHMEAFTHRTLREQFKQPLTYNLKQVALAKANGWKMPKGTPVRCGTSHDKLIATAPRLPRLPWDVSDIAAWRQHVYGLETVEDLTMEGEIEQEWEMFHSQSPVQSSPVRGAEGPALGEAAGMSEGERARFVQRMAEELGIPADQIQLSLNGC